MLGLNAGREVTDLQARVQAPVSIRFQAGQPVMTFNMLGDALV